MIYASQISAHILRMRIGLPAEWAGNIRAIRVAEHYREQICGPVEEITDDDYDDAEYEAQVEAAHVAASEGSAAASRWLQQEGRSFG